jgi:tripartite-type tricarboxylate transporter receptor subunit TctC
MTRRRLLLAAAGASIAPLGLLGSRAAHAQAWPQRPLRMVVPFPAGTSPDLIARMLTEPLARAVGQPVVVENRPGAGGNIGTGVVAKAEPDGYTWLFTIQGPLVTAPLLSRSLPYDPVRELEPVTLVATSPNVLVVHPGLGANTAAEFVEVARRRRGELNYGSVGNGSAAHLAMELFRSRTGIELVHVPFQGFPQVITAMLAGQVQAGFMVPAIAMPQVRAGKLRALGITSLGRTASLAELPTLREQGFGDFEAISWQAVLAPAGTPAPIVARVARELSTIIRSDEVRTRMLGQYFSAAGTAPEALRLLMTSERERWAKVIAAAGVKPE